MDDLAHVLIDGLPRIRITHLERVGVELFPGRLSGTIGMMYECIASCIENTGSTREEGIVVFTRSPIETVHIG